MHQSAISYKNSYLFAVIGFQLAVDGFLFPGVFWQTRPTSNIKL